MRMATIMIAPDTGCVEAERDEVDVVGGGDEAVSVVDDVNDETLGPWADLVAEAKITRPGPLNPFIEKELLKDADLSLDGSRFERVVGFTYQKPKVTKEELENIIESYKRMNWWP